MNQVFDHRAISINQKRLHPKCFQCAERHFVLMAGAGFDAAVIDQVDAGLKLRYGRPAFALAAFRYWAAGSFAPLKVSIDGNSFT